MAKKREVSQETMMAILLTFVATTVIVGAGVFLWMDSEKAELSSQVQTEANGTGSSAVSSAKAFEKAVNQKDYAVMENLMADQVNYVIESSGCCGKISRDNALQRFRKYTSNVKSWNFSQEQQVVKQMKVNLVDYFGDYTIGIGDNGAVLAYKLDVQGKVNDILVAVSHTMFDLE